MLTEKGLAFFICLFLEKKYAYLFLKQLQDFKEGEGKKGKASLETYCAYGLKLPKYKIESEKQDSLLYMDMINELKRCPSILYEHLRAYDKKRFTIKIEGEDNVNSLEPEAVLKRHEERFTYFTLRYLDESLAFDKLRFMMDLGNYHFDVYDKEIAGEMRVRRLTKKLLSFGRFQEFSKEKLYETYGDLVKLSTDIEEDSKIKYIVETFPHYHFDDSNVGIKIIDDKQRLYPDLKDASPKGAPHSKAPDLWMSQQELMSLALLCHLERINGRSVEAEKLIIKHYNSVRNLFKHLSEGKAIPEPNDVENWLKKEFNGLDIHDIPKDLYHCLIQKKKETSFADQAKNKIEVLIEETNKEIDRLDRDLIKGSDNRKNKIGRKEHREVKAGVLADKLAKDMLRFQPVLEGNKGKATGMVFQVLQASLAFFGSKKKELPIIFKDCNLIGSKNAHPFLEKLKAESSSGIVEFYFAYMEEKIRYLEECLKKQQFETYHWLQLNKSKRRSADGFLKQLAKNYLTMPIFFPRGLFMNAIKSALLKKAKTDDFKQLVAASERSNTVFLLQQFYNFELKDSAQEFYEYSRNYEILDKSKDKRNEKEKKSGRAMEKHYFSTKQLENQIVLTKLWLDKLPEDKYQSRKKRFNDFNQNEKQIRQQKAQDMVLLFLVKDLILISSDRELWKDNIENFKLKDIAPDSERGILAMQKPFTLELNFSRMRDNLEEKITKKITQEALKVKNFGDFRRFVKDRRLPQLMFYVEGENIFRDVLEKELEAYDVLRIEVFKVIADFERVAYPRYKDRISEADKNNEHKRILELFSIEFPQHKIWMAKALSIRNAFCHNQYPDSQMFSEIKSKNDFIVAEKLATFAKEKYEIFRKQISK